MSASEAATKAPEAYKAGWREGYEEGSTHCPHPLGSIEQVAYCFGAWYGFCAAYDEGKHRD